MPEPRLPLDLLRHWRVPPDAGETWVETFAPLQFVSYPLRDTSGRPLGEENAPEARRAGVIFEEKPCPYEDTRRGKPMNVTALRGVRQDWDGVVATTSVLRGAYGRRYHLAGAPLDLLHLFSFAAAVGSWPIFLVRSGACGPDAVPTEVASLFKVIQGVFMTAWAALRASDGRDRPLPGIEVLVRSIVASPILHSRSSSRVCGGPEGMIAEILDRCVNPRDVALDDTLEPLLDYGCTYAALSLEKWLSGRPASAATARVAAHRDRLFGETGPSITAMQVRMCRVCGIDEPTGVFDPGWIRPP